MRVITSFNNNLYGVYAHRLIETFKNFPGELIVYSEDNLKLPFEVRPMPTKGVNFKEKMARHKPSDWRWDVVKFSHKVFAITSGLWDYEGTGIWLDADCVIYKKVPESFIEGLIPEDSYCGHFYRTTPLAPYTETGFLMFRCGKPQHKPFMSAWRDYITTGKIFQSTIGWHDCIAFDEARKAFDGFVNLSSEDDPERMHPIAVSELGEYIDHCKGSRKLKGYSQEQRSRWWEASERPAVLGDAK
jgi:hypothetical protein